MKKRLSSFFAGMLTMALIGSLAIPVLASAGMTITVDPINIQVKGQVFQPKDVNGKDVPVFAYNGTTYAPLRALATAYGLEVGYDSSTNMATVSDSGKPTPSAPFTDYSNWSAEDETAYQEFKGLWDVELYEYDEKWDIQRYEAMYVGIDKAETSLKKFGDLNKYAYRIAEEYLEYPHQLHLVFVAQQNVTFGSETPRSVVLGSATFRFDKNSKQWYKDAVLNANFG